MTQNPYANSKAGAPPSPYPPPSPYTTSSFPPSNEVFEFLRSINFEKYYSYFTQNDVTEMRILSRLTNDDLREIGLPIGARRTILDEAKTWKQNSTINNNNNPNDHQWGANSHGVPESGMNSTGATGDNNVIIDTSNNNNNNNNSGPLASGAIENISRPWNNFIQGIAFGLPFPFFCFGIYYHFVGHTTYYKFDNDERSFEYYRFRGMCCYCLDYEDTSLNYSDIKCLRVGKDSSGQFIVYSHGKVLVETHDRQTFELPLDRYSLDGAKQEAEQISRFTGIPVETDTSSFL